MKKFYYYKSEEEVKIGDVIEIKRMFRTKLKGKVKYVYNPDKSSIPWGENPIGYSIELKNGSEMFVSKIDKNINLLKRGK